MREEKRKRAPILATIRRALVLIWKAGKAKQFAFTTAWIFSGILTSFMAVFHENFLNGAADMLQGKQRAFQSAVFWVLVWGATNILISLMGFLANRVLVRMWLEIEYYVGDTVMEKVSKVRLWYFDDRESQKKIRMAKNGVNNRIANVTNGVVTILNSVVTLVTSAIILERTSWVIAAVVVAATIPAIWMQYVQTDKQYELNQWDSYEGQMQRYLSLLLTKRKYIKEMRFYQLYDYIGEKYEKSVRELDKQQRKLSWFRLWTAVGDCVCNYGAIAIALALVSAKILSGQAKIGAFILVYNTVRNMQTAFKNIYSRMDGISSDGRYLEDYETVMGYEEETREEESEHSEEEDVEIRFEQVSFRYPGTDRDVLKEIHLTIRPGEKIAIVGENGSGKSTFVSLLTGLYLPTKGQVLVNGESIEKRLTFLRNRMSCTMQDYLQYSDSVAENVAIGDVRHEADPERIRKALDKAGVAEDIDALEEKECTYLGNLHPNSRDLSGGQWQKLAMARNLYKEQARIMLMDEPTAALDPVAESRLYQEFSNLTEDKTVILISHRLGAARLADRILVFRDGTIVEDGDHETLLQKGGYYTQMYQAQAQWYV